MPRRKMPELSQREITQQKLRRIRETEDIQEILELTQDQDPYVRAQSVRTICPCKVQDKIDLFWERVLEMVEDPDDNVRANVLHVLCDGSPEYLEDKVIQAVQEFNSDSNRDIKRKAHKVLGSYYSTGKWNVL